MWTDRRIISLLLYLSTQLPVASGGIVTGPTNVAAAVGTQTYFNCTATDINTNNILLWQKANADSYEDLYVSHGNYVPVSGFSVEVNPTNGQYNLIVSDVTMDKGVKYWCSTLGTNNKFYAELVAVDQLHCPSSGQEVTAGDVVTALCSVNYAGYMSPKLTWISSADDLLNGVSVSNTSKVESYFNFTADATYDMANLTCKLSFTTPGTLRDSWASNVPTYTTECSTYYVVKHGVTEIQFEPAADENGIITLSLSPGDSINCTSDGRPQPTYSWRNSDGSGSQETGDQLVITSDMTKLTQPLTYQCTASNVVNGQTYTISNNVTFTAVLLSSDQVKTSSVEPWVIAVAVVVPVVVIAAVIIGFCICKHRRGKRGKGSDVSAPFIMPTSSERPPPVSTYAPPRSAGPSPYAPGPTGASNPADASGYGDIGGQSLGASTNRNNVTPTARPAAPGTYHDGSSTGSRATTPQGRPAPTVSMLPDPRAASRLPMYDNPDSAQLPPAPRPPSDRSSTISGTSTDSSTTRGSGYNYASVNRGPPTARQAPLPVAPPTAGSRAGSRPTSAAAGSGLLGPFQPPPVMVFRPADGPRSLSDQGSLQGSIV